MEPEIGSPGRVQRSSRYSIAVDSAKPVQALVWCWCLVRRGSLGSIQSRGATAMLGWYIQSRRSIGSGRTLRRRGLLRRVAWTGRSAEHTSELQSLMRNSYAGFWLKKKKEYISNIKAQEI